MSDTDIAYVCLSDLHLGEEDSLLTHVDADARVAASQPSPVLLALIDCLRFLLRRNAPGTPPPVLILNGDVAELALASVEEAVETFGLFLRLLLADERPVGQIFYLPGNHDHHYWETARETQYRRHLERLPLSQTPGAPWHTTKIFFDPIDRLPSDILTSVGRRHLALGAEEEILVAYPNYVVFQGNRAAVFHHGHFIEPLYTAMSKLAAYFDSTHEAPGDVYTLEEENFAWIDFFWSTMGRSGRVGTDIENVYKALSDPVLIEKLIHEVATNIARKHFLDHPLANQAEATLIEAVLDRYVLSRILAGQERQKAVANPDWPLSDAATQGLERYVNVHVRGQLAIEQYRQEEPERPRYIMPERMTFVFGHTHKPFTRAGAVAGTTFDDTLALLNTGGWVVESSEDSAAHGAGVAVLNSSLDAVNIRLYNEGRWDVRVEEPGKQSSEFAARIRSVVADPGGPWTRFTDAAKQEVARRHQFRRERRSDPR